MPLPPYLCTIVVENAPFLLSPFLQRVQNSVGDREKLESDIRRNIKTKAPLAFIPAQVRRAGETRPRSGLSVISGREPRQTRPDEPDCQAVNIDARLSGHHQDGQAQGRGGSVSRLRGKTFQGDFLFKHLKVKTCGTQSCSSQPNQTSQLPKTFESMALRLAFGFQFSLLMNESYLTPE